MSQAIFFIGISHGYDLSLGFCFKELTSFFFEKFRDQLNVTLYDSYVDIWTFVMLISIFIYTCKIKYGVGKWVVTPKVGSILCGTRI